MVDIWDELDELFPIIAKVHKDATGQTLQKLPGGRYSPIVADRKYMALARWVNSPYWKNAMSFKVFCEQNKYYDLINIKEVKVDKTISEGIGAFYHHYPRIAVVITARGAGRDNAMAAAWHTPISFSPPLYGVVISAKRLLRKS